MSKLTSIILALILNLSLFAVTAENAYAQNLNQCKGIQVSVSPLLTTTPRATFTIDVGNARTPGVGGWNMQFDCGVQQLHRDTATIDPSGNTISVQKDNSALACEFSSGSHNIIVEAIINGNNVPQCTIGYNVLEANNQCKLLIDTDPPGQGITSASRVLVSGSGLNPRSNFNLLGYALFLDNQVMSQNVDTRNASNFSGVEIPTSLLIPGSHQVDLRYPTFSIPNPINSLPIPGLTRPPNPADSYSPPLCFAQFTVGTPNNPGSASTSGNGGKTPTGPVVTGGGKTCGTDAANQGIDTAIGCIHTSPVGFIKDFFKFIIGISGGIAFLMMLLGAFEMITSAGNPDSLKNGKDRFTSAVIGLLFVIFSILFLQIIGVGILNIPGFS